MAKNYFLCSEGLIESIKPKEKSSYIMRFGEKVGIAKIDFEEAKEFFSQFTEEQQMEYSFWCQEIVLGYVPVEGYDMESNIFEWIYENQDLSNLGNHCIAIGNVCQNEGITPIELFNKIYALSDT